MKIHLHVRLSWPKSSASEISTFARREENIRSLMKRSVSSARHIWPRGQTLSHTEAGPWNVSRRNVYWVRKSTFDSSEFEPCTGPATYSEHFGAVLIIPDDQ